MKLNILLFIILNLSFAVLIFPQNIRTERVLHQNILKQVKKDVEKHYFDPKLNGIDIENNFKKAQKLINKAKTSEEMTGIISRFLLLFNDSHVFFLPPKKTVSVDYGWELMLFDEKAFVVRINEESSAYKKGVRTGDQIYMIEGFIPNRLNFSTLQYHFNVLNPRPSLEIFLIKPSGNKYKLKIEAKVIKDNVFMPSTRDLDLAFQKDYRENVKPSFYQEINGLTIIKMPSFDMTYAKVDKMIDQVNKGDSLILDLRENGGGALNALAGLLNNLFEKEITICKVLERDGAKRYVTKPNSKIFKGKLIVLTGNYSASAAELFARIVQLEKRGTVIGDQTSGSVMLSQQFIHTFGLDSLIPYGASITIADVFMKDDQRLEKVGVTPDEKIIPSQMDIVKGRDPVLARAAKILGFEVSPEEAGKFFSKD